MPFTRDTDVFEEFEVFSDKMRKCIRYLSEPYLEKEGLRSHHVVFLFAIEKEDGMSQKDLKEHLPYDKSRISMVVSELISRGLVTNTSQGKTSSLELTEKGRATCEDVRALVTDFKNRILDSLSEEELELFLTCMKKFDSHLDLILETHKGTSN